MVLFAIPCIFFRGSVLRTPLRVMATKQFRRSFSVSGLGLPFFTNFYRLRKIASQVFFALLRDEPGAVNDHAGGDGFRGSGWWGLCV